MKIAGLITEYNPFHNGHAHHIEEARRLTGADYLIVVMSMDFVQRGAPAVIPWQKRAEMALKGGADLVLGLPVLFSTSSAEVFARAGIALLHLLGCVDSVVFGSEAGTLDPLQPIAEVLNEEPVSVREEIRTYVRAGYTYPKARAMALESYFDDSIDDISSVIASPNNILGIEYLRALSYFDSGIQPVTLKRWQAEHHSHEIHEDVASATLLRKLLTEENGAERVEPFVPEYTGKILKAEYRHTTPITENDFSGILQYRLVSEKDRLDDYLDFTPQLKERVQNLLPGCFTFTDWADRLNSRDQTLARIKRALMHLVLGITEQDLIDYKEEDYCMYARILGFRSKSAPLLTEIRRNTALPLISKMADAEKILTQKAFRLLRMDVFAADLYRNVVFQKYGTQLKDDFTSGIVKLNA